VEGGNGRHFAQILGTARAANRRGGWGLAKDGQKVVGVVEGIL